MSIKLDEAIKMAIDYENKVQKVYADAAARIADPKGQHVFGQLAEEEAGHVAYLVSRLEEWQKDGKINVEELQTIVPDKERISAGRKRLSKSLRGKHPATSEVEFLKRALEAEKEASDFYLRMVSELPAEHQKLFSRFVQIEEGHLAIVQAEIDAVQGSGFWFDMKEFDLEVG
jgi:rubrerythrin